MSDDTNTTTARPVLLRPETQDALRAMFRAAGGVFYGAPKGETATILETNLFQLLAGLVAQADASGAQRAALLFPDSVQQGHEQALRALVGAICPGLDSGDLLADAATAVQLMARAPLAGYFGIDDEPAGDGSARYMHVGSQYKNDDDVFPLYRRALTLLELDEQAALRKAGADSKAGAGAGDAAAGTASTTATKATPASKGGAGKAASK